MKEHTIHHAKELVEKIGVAVEHAGYSPAVGRVLACLLVSDPPYMTFDEVRRFLGISKSAVSNALNALISREMVDYITLPGDRRRHFRLAEAGLIAQVKKRIGFRSAMPELLREVIRARSNRYPDFNRSLHELVEFLVFMDREINAALEKWETVRHKKL